MNVFRPDVVRPSLTQEQALAAAPNGAGVNPPQYGQVIQGAQQATGV